MHTPPPPNFQALVRNKLCPRSGLALTLLQVEGLLCSEPLSSLQKSPVLCTQQAPLSLLLSFKGPGCLRMEDPEPTLHHLPESCPPSSLFCTCWLCIALPVATPTLPPASLHTLHRLSPTSSSLRSLQPLFLCCELRALDCHHTPDTPWQL